MKSLNRQSHSNKYKLSLVGNDYALKPQLNKENRNPLLEVLIADSRFQAHRIVNAADTEKEKAVLTLFDNGVIHVCDPASGRLLDCSPGDLLGQPITRLLPQLDKIKLVQNRRPNSYLRFLSRIGCHFEVLRMSGTRFSGKLFFSDVEISGRHYLRVIIRPARQGGDLAIYV